MEELEWFKARQKIFANDGISRIPQAVKFAEDIIILQFELKGTLKEIYQKSPNDVEETFAFILDQEIENLQGLIHVIRAGLFSCGSIILRALLISLGKIAYYYESPDKCLDLRESRYPSDTDLINFLKDKKIIPDDDIYRNLSKATHSNFGWAEFARHAKILSIPDVAIFLLMESVIISANMYCLQSAVILATRISCYGEYKNIIKSIAAFREGYEQLYSDFVERVEKLPPSKP